MTTVIKRLGDDDQEDWDILQGMHERGYLHGECYAFAIALHRGLGWPIVGVINTNDIAEHVGVRTPEGLLRDIRGAIDEESFAEPYSKLKTPLVFREVTEKELYDTREVIHDQVIAQARIIAESLWPELPWKDSKEARLKAFADELEQLSRKYSLWVCAPVPTQKPVLFNGNGDEKGYDLLPTVTGNAYLINRRL